MTFLLIDSRIELQKIDLEFMTGLKKYKVPFTILFTKTDKLNKQELQQNSDRYKKQLKEVLDPLPDFILTSSATRFGREDILGLIENLL